MTDEKKTNNLDGLFYFIDRDEIASEKITAPRYSYWKSVFRVFFRKKGNIVLLSLFVLMLLVAFVMPNFWPYDMFENVTNAKTFNMSPRDAMKFFDGGIKWSLGTGAQGNSIFFGIISSARTSLLLAMVVTTINMVVGVVAGAIWGYSKRLDIILLVIYQIIANVPQLLVLTVLVYVIGSGFWQFVFALTITEWLYVAYFFRTQVIIIRDREYSLASRCLGTPISRMITKNILPYLTSVIVTLLSAELPGVVNSEVYLSYLGLDLRATVPSLGRMIQQAQSGFMTFTWAFWPPVFVAGFITIILYLLGQNLADATDPRTHM